MKRLQFATLIFLFSVLFISVAAAQALTREALLPDDADMVILISDTQKLATALKASPFGKLMASDEMLPFLNGQDFDSFLEWVASQENPKSETIDPRRWKLIAKEMKMLSGEVVLGYTIPEGEVYGAVAISAADFKHSLELDTTIADLDTKDYYFKKETFRGIDIHIQISQEGDKLTSIYQAFYQGTLLVSHQRSWVEASLARLMQHKPVEPVRDPQIRIAFQPGAIEEMTAQIAAEQKKAAEKSAGEGAKPPVEAQTVMKALGLTALQGIALSVEMKPNRCEVNTEISHTANTPGIWSLFPTRPLSTATRLPYVPSDWTSYGIFDLNVSELWQQVPLILEQISPKALQTFTAGIQMANAQLQIDLSRDFFLNLEGKGFSISRFNENRQEILMGWELHDAPKLERVFTTLFAEGAMLRAQLASFYSQSDIKGHLMHQFNIPNAGGRGGEDSELVIAFGISQGMLVGGHQNLVSAFYQAGMDQRPADRFYRSVAFQKTMALLPDRITGYSTGKFSRLAAFIMDSVKDLAIAASANDEVQPQDQENFFKRLRFNRLPPSDFLFKFFGDSISYSQYDGATLKAKTMLFYQDPESGS